MPLLAFIALYGALTIYCSMENGNSFEQALNQYVKSMAVLGAVLILLTILQ